MIIIILDYFKEIHRIYAKNSIDDTISITSYDGLGMLSFFEQSLILHDAPGIRRRGVMIHPARTHYYYSKLVDLSLDHQVY